MKKLATILFIVLLASTMWGQNPVKTITKNFTATGSSAILTENAGFGVHTIIWTTTATTSACTIALQSASTYGGSYTTLGAAQTCTSSGSYTYVGTANFVKLNMTALTVSGNGHVVVTYYALPNWYPSAAMATYTNAGVPLVGAMHTVIGTCTLGTSCSVTLTAPAAFTSTTSYRCTATDNTAAAAVKIVQTSATQIDLTGTGTDVLSYICVGS